MKRPLFWKILIGVWAMFFAVAVGLSMWTQWEFYGNAGYRTQMIGSIETYTRRYAAMAAVALRYGGMTALNELLATWTDADRTALSVREATTEEAATADVETNSQPADPAESGEPAATTAPAASTVSTATPAQRPAPSQLNVATAEGVYHLSFDYPWSPKDYAMPFRLSLETPQLVVEALASLLFSLALAWHLTRPLQRVREGMDRLARGDLAARLDPKTRGRRDEIGALARDFDYVAMRLEALVRSRDLLLHEVSHECRSPLARIRVAIDLARQDDTRMMSSFARIDEESRRLDSMIGDLLTLARTESGVVRADSFVDVRALIQAVVADARFEAAPAGILIEVNDAMPSAVGAALPPVCGDVELLRRTLENVLRNSLSVSNAGHQIDVTVQTNVPEGYYLIEVADQGPGVVPETLATMFEPFVRLESRANPGFGLGLAIAKRAIEALRGSITASNRATGGLVVSIRLPFAAVEMASIGQFA